MQSADLTIGDVADAAGVGVETIRYYERRGLVLQPGRSGAAYRRYGAQHVERVRFIKRAQALGFSLEEIATLLELEDGTDRRSIRRIAGARLEETRRRIADLQRIEHALAHLLHDCEAHSKAKRCPIIAAMTHGGH
ncbi:MAG TPA: MerR family transcriptional regulator [Burkholderiales bacterium]|nr:MerR family transcriptional regulator [Burkholderiales bacterium]